MSHYPPITPHLAITDVASALDFYAKAFGAEERLRLTLPDGTVAHAEMTIEGGLVTLGAAIPEYGLEAPDPDRPVQAAITVFGPDVDDRYARAVARRRDHDERAGRPVPRRPDRLGALPVRAQVDPRHAPARRAARGAAAPARGDHVRLLTVVPPRYRAGRVRGARRRAPAAGRATGRSGSTGPRPAARLADVVEQFWSVEWELPAGRHHEQAVVTHPCGHLTVEGGRRLGAAAWSPGSSTAGSPAAAGSSAPSCARPGCRALTDVPPATLTDRRVPGDGLLGDVSGLAAVAAAPDVQAGMAAFEAGWPPATRAGRRAPRWSTTRSRWPPSDAT